MLPSDPILKRLRRKTPQIILIAVVIAIACYLWFEVIADVAIEGAPLTSDPLINAIISFTRNVTATVSSWGYSGVFMLMLLESSSVPIPSEMILPFAGYLISLEQMSFWVTVIVATIAGAAGSLVDYYIGLKGVHVLAQHRLFGKIVLSTNQLETGKRWFSKHGAIMVFLGRLVPGFRTAVSFPAGAVKMPLLKFLAYTTVGCLVWTTVLIYVGFVLGSRWHEVTDFSRYFIIGAVATAVILVVAFLVWRHRKTRKPPLIHNA
jgi:membrane protein DedA with SNARE-associated domain